MSDIDSQDGSSSDGSAEIVDSDWGDDEEPPATARCFLMLRPVPCLCALGVPDAATAADRALLKV